MTTSQKDINIYPIYMGSTEVILKDDNDSDTGIEVKELSSINSESVINTDNAAIDNAAFNIENSSDVIIGPVTQFHGPVTIYQNVNNASPSTPPLAIGKCITNDCLPKIDENHSIDSESPKERMMELLDVIEGHVEELRKEVSQLEEDRDQLLSSLNSVKNADLIHELAESKLIKSESGTSDVPNSKNYKLFPFNNKYMKYIGYIVVLLLLGLTVIIPLIIVYGPHERKVPSSDPDEPDNSSLLPSNHLMVYRDTWGGRPRQNNTVPLKHPTPLVIISHTVTQFCKEIKQCSRIVRSIQDYHVGQLGSPDVGYNFLIGGDGNIYVARGWDIRNFHQENSIGVSFIGNYLYDKLTDEMIDAAQYLLRQGVLQGKLSKEYKLVAHNQTWNTQSPGGNVYKVIKHWPHFDKNYS